MVAYELSRTLSENGTVSRGVCSVNAAGDLTGMVEHTQIERTAAGIVDHGANGDEPLAEDTPVSITSPTPRLFFGRFCRRVPGI